MARVFRKLAQLLDVNVSGVSDGDALVWDDGTQSWVPGAGGGGGGVWIVCEDFGESFSGS